LWHPCRIRGAFIDLINAVIDRQVFLHDWEHLAAAKVLPD